MRRLNLTRMGQRDPETVSRSLPGDRCRSPHGGCRGSLTVYTTYAKNGIRTRYLECTLCKWKPDDSKWVTPEDD